jgi:hypothetical protein
MIKAHSKMTVFSSLMSTTDLVTAKRMTNAEGKFVGWFIDHPEFYCDICPEDENWSVYFRDRNTNKEVYAESPTINLLK